MNMARKRTTAFKVNPCPHCGNQIAMADRTVAEIEGKYLSPCNQCGRMVETQLVGEPNVANEIYNPVTPSTPWPTREPTKGEPVMVPKQFCDGEVLILRDLIKREMDDHVDTPFPQGNDPAVEVELLRSAIKVALIKDHPTQLDQLVQAAREFLIRKFNADKPADLPPPGPLPQES